MGRAWIFGDDVSTDHIIPGRENITIDPVQLSKNLFKYARPDFSKSAKPTDVIIAGNNFGCGSSREHAVTGLKERGMILVAKSFGWIFYRNCINNGVLPLQVIDEIDIDDGDEVEVDLKKFQLKTKNKVFRLKPLPDFICDICEAGGLVSYLNKYGGYLK